MSWIPIPPMSSNDTVTPSASSNPYSYPPPMNVPPPTFGIHPNSTHQPHWCPPNGPQEELFPIEKTANIQAILDKCNDQIFIGLEYVVEIQHVAQGQRGSWYSCRLCDVLFQSKDGTASCIDNMRQHLTLASHKLNYLQKHFKIVKEHKLEPPKNVCTLEGIDKIIDKIEIYYGRLKVRLVIGLNLYFSSLNKIDEMINIDKHFEENSGFIDILLKNKKSTTKGKTTIYASPEPRKISKSRERRNSSTNSTVISVKTENTSQISNDLHQRRYKSRDKKQKSRSQSQRRDTDKADKRRKESRSRSSSKANKIKEKRDKKEKRRHISNTPNNEPKRKSSDSFKDGKYSRSRSRSRIAIETQIKSRSRSRNNRKSRLSNPSLSPIINEKENVGGKTQKKKSKGEIILSFLEEEVVMLQEMEKERALYYDTPSKHPLYENEWGKFWKKKYEELRMKGMNIGDYNMTPEWTVEWRNFFDCEHAKKVLDKKVKLLTKWDLKSKDIEQFNSKETTTPKKPAPEVISLIDSDDSDEDSPPEKEVVRSVSPWEDNSPPPPVQSRPSTSKMSLPFEKTEISRKKRPKSDLRRSNNCSPQSKIKLSAEDVSILGTLRFLSALEATSLLGNLGPTVDQLMGTALGLENDEYGSSQLLVDQNECYNLMDQARELIQHKLASGLVPDKQKKVCKITLDNITVLLKQSSCKKTDILEIDTSMPSASSASSAPLPDDPRLIKMTIADTISKELKSSGTIIRQEEFNSLVEAEYVRVKHQLPSRSQNQISLAKSLESAFHTGTQNTNWVEHAHPELSNQQLFSAYSFPNTSHNSLNTISSPIPGPVQNTPTIDWTSLINIMSAVQKNTDEGKSDIAEEKNQVKTEVNPYEVLTEDEVVELIKNFQQLDEDEKKNFIDYMKKLENVNPEKVKRMKRKMYSNK